MAFVNTYSVPQLIVYHSAIEGWHSGIVVVREKTNSRIIIYYVFAFVMCSNYNLSGT